MAEFGIEIADERRATLRLDGFPETLRKRLIVTMTEIERKLEAAVKAQEPKRTGALLNLTGGRVYDHNNRVSAVVGVRASTAAEATKAAALEYGSSKGIVVRTHQASLDHVYARAISPITVTVGQHTRRLALDPRRFLRQPLDAMRGQAIADLREAITAAIAESGAAT